MRELARGLLISFAASIVSVGAWILAFADLAVVPDGTTFPDRWLSFTSGDQIEWLRAHTVELKSFDAGVYMMTHLSRYGLDLFWMLAVAWVSAALAIAGWWYLTREDVEAADGHDGAVPARFQRKIPDGE